MRLRMWSESYQEITVIKDETVKAAGWARQLRSARRSAHHSVNCRVNTPRLQVGWQKVACLLCNVAGRCGSTWNGLSHTEAAAWKKQGMPSGSRVSWMCRNVHTEFTEEVGDWCSGIMSSNSESFSEEKTLKKYANLSRAEHRSCVWNMDVHYGNSFQSRHSVSVLWNRAQLVQFRLWNARQTVCSRRGQMEVDWKCQIGC